MKLKQYIQNIPDFPIKGIMFKDITPLISEPTAFQYVIDQLAVFALKNNVTAIAAPDARGFIFGAALAYKIGVKLIMVRKGGKLPPPIFATNFNLEYKDNGVLEINQNAVKKGERILILDDVFATGGTVKAIEKLVLKTAGHVVGMAFVVNIGLKKGNLFLKNRNYFSLINY